MPRLSSSIIAIAVVALAVCPVAATADTTAVYVGSSAACNGGCSASALFDLSGTTLTVTLTNTSRGDVLTPTDVLTAVWFDTTKTLTPVSVSLGTSTVYYGTITNPASGYGYYSGLAGGAHGMNGGLTAVGFGIGTGHSNFPGGGGVSLQGLDYGILSAGDNPSTGDAGVTAHGPLVKDTVVFTLSTASGFTLSNLSNTVVFQYGTALTDTHFNGRVPEPPVTALLACSTLLFGGLFRRFRWSVF